MNIFIRKFEVNNSIDTVINWIENQFDIKIKIIQLNSKKTLGNWFKSFCKNCSIEYYITVSDISEQNSPIERAERIIIKKSFILIADAGLPKNLWPELFPAAVYILNRLPTKSLG